MATRKNYDLIYLNGDSYMTHAQGPALDHYLAKHFNADSINMAVGGACNSRILRTSLRDAIRLKDKKILMIIGLSGLLRSEIWVDGFGSSDRKKKFDNDGDFYSFNIIQTHGKYFDETLGKQYQNYIKVFYQNYNEEAAYLELLTRIIGFTSYCQQNSIDYIIFSSFELIPNPLVDVNTMFIKDLHDHVRLDDRIIPFDEFCFIDHCLSNGFIPFDYDEYGNKGHHGTDAHKHFSKFLISRFNW